MQIPDSSGRNSEWRQSDLIERRGSFDIDILKTLPHCKAEPVESFYTGCKSVFGKPGIY